MNFFKRMQLFFKSQEQIENYFLRKYVIGQKYEGHIYMKCTLEELKYLCEFYNGSFNSGVTTIYFFKDE